MICSIESANCNLCSIRIIQVLGNNMSFFQFLASYFCAFLVCCFCPHLPDAAVSVSYSPLQNSLRDHGFAQSTWIQKLPSFVLPSTATPRNKSQDVSTQLTLALIRRTNTFSRSSSTVLYATIPSSSIPTSSSWGSSSPESPRGTPLKALEVLWLLWLHQSRL